MSSSTDDSPDAKRKAFRRPVLTAVLALACLVWVVFFPILGFEFVGYDVREQVLDYPYIRGLTAENLKHIFTTRHVRSYYPVRTLSFAIDYEIWGLNPGGFKLTNVLVHLANMFLLFWLILRLHGRRTFPGGRPTEPWDVLTAACFTGVFAVHPVVVEPVVWVAGREELLMTLGTLGCIHFHLSARRLEEDRGKAAPALACHAGAAFCCAAASLSNAVAAVIPPMIVALDVLMPVRPKPWKILSGTAALWALGIATILIKTSGCPSDAQVMARPFSGPWAMVILRTYFLNLKTLAWPTHQSLTYVSVMPAGPWETKVMLGGLAAALTGLVLWKLRKRKLVLFGLLWFCLALGPSAQIIPHHVHRADRFLYLPLAGLMVAAAMSLRRPVRAVKGRLAQAGMLAVTALILFPSAALSARQVQSWRNGLAVWQQCLKVDTNNPAAHAGLAEELAAAKGFQYAIPHFREALRLNPRDTTTLNNFALYLAACDDEQLRDYEWAIRLAKRGSELAQEDKPRLLHTLAIAYTNLAVVLAAEGQFEGAIENCKEAIQADPGYDKPRTNLAILLAKRRGASLPEANGPKETAGPRKNRGPGID